MRVHTLKSFPSSTAYNYGVAGGLAYAASNTVQVSQNQWIKEKEGQEMAEKSDLLSPRSRHLLESLVA